MKGSCLCNAVRYEARGPLRDIVACHCTECRKTSGHFTAATAVRPEHLRVVEDRGLRWFRSSEIAQRGFCHHCGSTLFWKPDSGDRISVYAGSIDSEHNLKMTAHIFVSEKGSYYEADASGCLETFAEGGASLKLTPEVAACGSPDNEC